MVMSRDLPVSVPAHHAHFGNRSQGNDRSLDKAVRARLSLLCIYLKHRKKPKCLKPGITN